MLTPSRLKMVSYERHVRADSIDWSSMWWLHFYKAKFKLHKIYCWPTPQNKFRIEIQTQRYKNVTIEIFFTVHLVVGIPNKQCIWLRGYIPNKQCIWSWAYPINFCQLQQFPLTHFEHGFASETDALHDIHHMTLKERAHTHTHTIKRACRSIYSQT